MRRERRIPSPKKIRPDSAETCRHFKLRISGIQPVSGYQSSVPAFRAEYAFEGYCRNIQNPGRASQSQEYLSQTPSGEIQKTHGTMRKRDRIEDEAFAKNKKRIAETNRSIRVLYQRSKPVHRKNYCKDSKMRSLYGTNGQTILILTESNNQQSHL
jgi:hypothetical protein